MVLLLATLLGAAPALKDDTSPTPPARTVALRTRIDFGGLIISYWYVPESRVNIEAALDNARGSLLGSEILDGHALLKAVPVAGPWTAALQEGSMAIEERALLCVTGVLQLAGLWLGARQLFDPAEGAKPRGPVLSLSPIAAGRLGISVKLVGY